MTALAPFDSLPLKERLFVRGRLLSAPLVEVARRTPIGKIADVGCGHGVLSSLLATEPRRQVVGVDPDPRKIEWARASVGRLPNARFEVATIEELAEQQPASFDAVVVADVLYLLPLARWTDFLHAAHASLKPGGTLLLKEAEADGSWRYLKCRAQEQLMVHVLRRTHSSGGLGFQPREATEQILRSVGFKVEDTISLARGYSTPHVLFVATR